MVFVAVWLSIAPHARGTVEGNRLGVGNAVAKAQAAAAGGDGAASTHILRSCEDARADGDVPNIVAKLLLAIILRYSYGLANGPSAIASNSPGNNHDPRPQSLCQAGHDRYPWGRSSVDRLR